MRRNAFPILAALVAVGALFPAQAASRRVCRGICEQPKIRIAGLPDRCEDESFVVRVGLKHDRLGYLRVKLDGRTVATGAARRVRFELDCSTLPYGEHELEVSASALHVSGTTKRVSFVVAEPEV
jgi:hypothetical protein